MPERSRFAGTPRAESASRPRVRRSPVSSRRPPNPVHPAAAPSEPQARQTAPEPLESETSAEPPSRLATMPAIRSAPARTGSAEDGRPVAILRPQVRASDPRAASPRGRTRHHLFPARHRSPAWTFGEPPLIRRRKDAPARWAVGSIPVHSVPAESRRMQVN